jgi:hypothetical protein
MLLDVSGRHVFQLFDAFVDGHFLQLNVTASNQSWGESFPARLIARAGGLIGR